MSVKLVLGGLPSTLIVFARIEVLMEPDLELLMSQVHSPTTMAHPAYRMLKGPYNAFGMERCNTIQIMTDTAATLWI